MSEAANNQKVLEAIGQDLNDFDSWIGKQTQESRNFFVSLVHGLRAAHHLDKQAEVQEKQNLLKAASYTTPFTEFPADPDCKTIVVIPGTNASGFTVNIGGWGFPVASNSLVPNFLPNLIEGNVVSITGDGGGVTYTILQLRERWWQ